jgi:hypothetical protein
VTCSRAFAAGDPLWEEITPPAVAELIKSRGLNFFISFQPFDCIIRLS